MRSERTCTHSKHKVCRCVSCCHVWGAFGFRLVCKIQEKNKPGQDLKMVLEVHEGEVEGRYSIEGSAQIRGFSFVVGTFCLLTRSGTCFDDDEVF